jgi:hypothetical protein
MIHKYCFLGVEVRHDRGVELEDELVLQVSQFKWLVASDSGAAGRQRQQFSVKRNADVADDEDRDKEGCKICADWNMDYGDTSSCDDGTNESYCEKCDICSCFYTCNCSDGHSLCEHVHKVHSLIEKVFFLCHNFILFEPHIFYFLLVFFTCLRTFLCYLNKLFCS